MISPDSVLRRADGVRAAPDGTLSGVASPAVLNRAGVVVWDHLDGCAPLSAIAADLAAATGEPVAVVRTELVRLGTLLCAAGAVVVVGPDDRPTGTSPSRSARTPGAPVVARADDRPSSSPAVPSSAAVACWLLGDRRALEGRDPAEVHRACAADGLLGALAVAVAEGAVVLDEPDDRRLRHWVADAAARSQALEGAAAAASRALSTAGIDHRLLKGMATSRLDHPRAEARPMRDVDLLVPRPSLPAAVDALVGLGGRRRGRELRPGFDVDHAKAVTVVLGGAPAGGPPVEVDLHASLVAGAYGVWADPAPVFAGEGRAVRLRGRWVPALSLEDAFLHACCTAVVGEWEVTLPALLEVAVLARRRPDPSEVARRAEVWRLGPVVERATWLAALALPVARDDLARLVPHPRRRRWRERVVARAELLPGRNHVLRELLTVAVVPGARARARYARAVAVPVAGGKGPLLDRGRRALRSFGPLR